MSISDNYRLLFGSGVGGVQPTQPGAGKPGAPAKAPGTSDFHKLLEEKQTASAASQPLNFSQHAETRIKSRQIPWDSNLEARVRGGIDAAQAKGSREALILADNVALIANVKSRTIVTAMDRTQLKERIFTNIDSAVLV